MSYRVLCAYDGSASAERAFDLAAILAKRFEGQLHVITVVPPSEPPVKNETMALLKSGRERFSGTFEQLRKREAAGGLSAVFEVSVGYPAQQILIQAEQLDVHHIVTGRRGLNPLDRWSMGSVSQRIVLHAKALVTVVP